MDNIHVFQGGKAQTEDKSIPTNDYVIYDRDNNEYFASGFMIFTSQHIAVMQDQGNGAIPVFVLPLDRLQVAELVDDEDEADAPF